MGRGQGKISASDVSLTAGFVGVGIAARTQPPADGRRPPARSNPADDNAIVGVNSREQLRKLALELGVRHDWHEPDEQEVTAEVQGSDLDNAMGPLWGLTTPTGTDGYDGELKLVLSKDGRRVASINLASLLSWACEN